jgi:hypothetical protein
MLRFMCVGVMLGSMACGTELQGRVRTGPLDGDYQFMSQQSLQSLQRNLASGRHATGRAAPETMVGLLERRFTPFRISEGVIGCGTFPEQEFLLQSGELTDTTFRGRAVWLEDANDPGDMASVRVQLSLSGELLEFSYGEDHESDRDRLVFRRLGS